jgi:hypothetical protein
VVAGKVIDADGAQHRFAFARNSQAALVLPGTTPALDWWHSEMRFEHTLQAARGPKAPLAQRAARDLERAKWRLWYGRGAGCRERLAALSCWTRGKDAREAAGVGRLQRHVTDLLGYLERNQEALVPYAARRRHGQPISTAFVESAVNAIVAKRMNKVQ